MRIIQINESQLKSLVKNIVSEQPDEKMPGQIERFGYKADDSSTLGPALDKQQKYFSDVNKGIKEVIDNYGFGKCIPYTMKPFVYHVFFDRENITKKLNITLKELVMFTKAAIGIMGRESDFTKLIHLGDGQNFFTPRYLEKNMYNFLGRYEWARKLGIGGQTGSYGPAQITKGTWNKLDMKKLFNMDENQLYTVIGAGMGTIANLNKNYKLAMRNGYSSSTKSSNAIGTGNAALDIAIAGHNIGEPTKWCRTNDPKFAAPCNSPKNQYKPFPKEKPNLILKVLPDQIQNYIPNKVTEKYASEYENTPLTTHNYIKEVAGYMPKYSCLDGIATIK